MRSCSHNREEVLFLPQGHGGTQNEVLAAGTERGDHGSADLLRGETPTVDLTR